MAWFCERCGDFMIWNSYYCDECREKNYREWKIEQKAKQRAKEERNKKIREDIREYKDNQSLQIEKKYGIVINFELEEDLKVLLAEQKGRTEYENIEKASKVQILYHDKSKQYKIDDLKKELEELKEALKELEAIKNEIF